MTAMLVTDPDLVQRLRAERERLGLDKRDEVWDGVYVMSPLPNTEHQMFVAEFWAIFKQVVVPTGLGYASIEANVSDREEGWTDNYREPDVLVVLHGGLARDCGTHWCGGPDFLVEILSPNDPARRKLDFYSKIGVRELLMLDRYPWALELYRLIDGQLQLVGTSTPEQPQWLPSAVLPLRFRLVAGEERPRIEVVHSDGEPRWVI